MKRFFANPLAFIAAAFTIALSVAFVIGISPDITPAPNWHVSVDTLANRVTWFGHTGSCNAGLPFVLLLFKTRSEGWFANLMSFTGTMLAAGIIGYGLTIAFGVPPVISSVIGFALLFASGVYDWHKTCQANFTPSTDMQCGLAKQIWIPQLMEKFYPAGSHLLRSQDMTAWVNYHTINLADAGVDPDVMIDNTAYPIDTDERTDTPLTITLSRFRTKNTTIRDAEAVELAYNKMESVVAGHRRILSATCVRRATYSWAPQADSKFTPVITTTGDMQANGQRKMVIEDLAAAQADFDNNDVPQEGRVLVFNPTHAQHIMSQDALLFKAFTNLKAGEVMPLFGFDVYKTSATPTYNGTTKTKNAYGSAPLGTDVIASLFYLETEVMRCDGDVSMYSLLNDPYADGDTVGFAKRFVAVPIRNKAIGAIISAVV